MHYFVLVRMRNNVISASVCLSVCLFVCLSDRIFQKPHVQISPKFLYVLCVAVVWFFSSRNAIRYVLPVLWMTSCFHIIEQMGRIRDDAHVSSSLAGGGTGGEVCRLRRHLVILSICSGKTDLCLYS